VSAPHITPTRLVDLSCGDAATPADVAALIATVRAYWTLTHNLQTLSERGAVIVEESGDEIELEPGRIELRLESEAEAASIAADEAYYGGDGPTGCYGPDDTRGGL
jgi:hypothetical protein